MLQTLPLDRDTRSVLTAMRQDRSPLAVVRGLPIGDIPQTPARPTEPTSKDGRSEQTLVAVASSFGEVVGYLPEHGGSLVQNLVPVASQATRQTSTSSAVDLGFHTETAFHPHRPSHVVLLCLRGDPAAATTICTVDDVVAGLDDRTVAVLSEPRFRCGVDESFGGRPDQLGDPAPVLQTSDDGIMTLWFDEHLMVGVDADASAALQAVRDVVHRTHRRVVLEAGDALVIDNDRAVHGRTSYKPRFDGTDRWLQRAFVVADLAPSASERDGRIITTVW